MFDGMVAPVMDYASDIWGARNTIFVTPDNIALRLYFW